MHRSGDEPGRDGLARMLREAQAGDRGALQALFAASRGPLLERIRWMMGDEARRVAESDDFLQATFAAALVDLDSFARHGSDSFLRWLTAIARNRIRHDVRQHREMALSMLSTALGDLEDSNGDERSIDAALSLVEALTRLSPSQAELIERRDLEGCSWAEIGARLGCSERHAHRLHAQALLQLGRLLRGPGD